MGAYPYGAVPRRPRRSRGGRIVRVVVLFVALAAVFVLGVALGKALNDGPKAARTVTYVRTLAPLPQRPSVSTAPR
jgi:hypothetical protein